MSTSESENKTPYEIEPFELIFLRRREQILQLVGVTGHALRHMEGAARLSEVLKRSPDVVDRIRDIETLALAEIKSDMPLLHGAAVVLIWGSLEAAIRDFLVRWMARNPSARLVPELRNVRVRVAEYESFDGEDRMRYLVSVLERELGASLKPGAGRFDCLLQVFGFRPQISDEQRRNLNELAAVRNVIVHRAGIADDRLLTLCPWLPAKVGDVVLVDGAAFGRYVHAASEYAAEILHALRVKAEQAQNPAAQPSAAGDAPQAARP